MDLANRTGLVLSDEFRAHEGTNLPERPERIAAIRKGLVEANLLDKLVMVPVPESNDFGARNQAMRWIRENHTAEYLQEFEQACTRGEDYLKRSEKDGKPVLDDNGNPENNNDTPISTATFDVTWRATSSVLQTTNRVAKGMLKNAFCVVRPPGHHAEEHRAMGFCYVNHIAVAARYLLGEPDGFAQPDGSRLKFDRVLIVDIDLHHGNGAEDSFKENEKVMFCSFHGDPATLWPGSGLESVHGKHGNILNIPFEAGSKSKLFHERFEEKFLKKADDFKPQFILVSAGFDMHFGDPLNRNPRRLNYVSLDFNDFKQSASLLTDLARRHCNGKLVSILEGGYNLEALGGSAAAHIGELLK